MKSLKFSLIALVALLTIAVGYGYGCGGGDDTSGGGSTAASQADTTSANGGGDSTEAGEDDEASSGPLTKPQFVKQADAICEKVPVRYRELLGELEKENKKDGKSKPSVAEGNLAAAVPPLPEAAEELEALSPPSGDEQEVEAMIAALESAAEGLEAKPTSALSGPQSPFAEFQKLTGAYGLKVCSQL
jgi:hypothetical protein